MSCHRNREKRRRRAHERDLAEQERHAAAATVDRLTSMGLAEIASSLIANAIERGDIADGGLAVSYRVDVRITVVPAE